MKQCTILVSRSQSQWNSAWLSYSLLTSGIKFHTSNWQIRDQTDHTKDDSKLVTKSVSIFRGYIIRMIKPQCDLEIQSISGTNFSVPQWQIDIVVPPYDNLSLENSANHRHRPNRVAFNVVHIGLKLHGKTSKNMDVYIGKQCKKKQSVPWLVKRKIGRHCTVRDFLRNKFILILDVTKLKPWMVPQCQNRLENKICLHQLHLESFAKVPPPLKLKKIVDPIETDWSIVCEKTTQLWNSQSQPSLISECKSQPSSDCRNCTLSTTMFPLVFIISAIHNSHYFLMFEMSYGV